ncbi:hypothetical protein [Cryptosporangium sp. NPDC048952]|uniref:hypothetical protein n=1 Tax=Cryptosporangium sp. NPDC048952 TaxID=3363961 RepID=UPI00371EBE9C
MPDVTHLAATAAHALSTRFGPVHLTATTGLTSSRSTVFRAHVEGPDQPPTPPAPASAGPGAPAAAAGVPASVVVKAPGRGGPWRERAALEVLHRAGVRGVPALLATSDDPQLVVLADAGTGPSLADHLIGTNPAAATRSLLTWAETTATFQAATVGLEVPFVSALTPPMTADSSADLLAEAATALAALLPQLGVTPRPEALEALRAVAETLPPDARAMDPGDACPDNNIETPDGPVLLDFEFAEYRHVAWHAAYLRVPWPTCWCSWRLPSDVVEKALDRWRHTLAPSLPSVATDAFDATLDLVTAAWVLLSVSWFLPAALAGDPPTTEPTRPRPSRRQMIQYRLGRLAELPVAEPLATLGAETHAATVQEWGSQPLPLAPAYR